METRMESPTDRKFPFPRSPSSSELNVPLRSFQVLPVDHHAGCLATVLFEVIRQWKTLLPTLCPGEGNKKDQEPWDSALEETVESLSGAKCALNPSEHQDDF